MKQGAGRPTLNLQQNEWNEEVNKKMRDRVKQKEEKDKKKNERDKDR